MLNSTKKNTNKFSTLINQNVTRFIQLMNFKQNDYEKSLNIFYANKFPSVMFKLKHTKGETAVRRHSAKLDTENYLSFAIHLCSIQFLIFCVTTIANKHTQKTNKIFEKLSLFFFYFNFLFCFQANVL